MKRIFSLIVLAAAVIAAVSCEKKDDTPKTVDVFVQLMYNDAPLQVEGVMVTLTNMTGSFEVDATTDASGLASYNVVPDIYSVSATYSAVEDGKKAVYNGSASAISVVLGSEAVNANLSLSRAESQQIIIKELYCTGCPDNTGKSSYSSDAYVILYNNSEFEADASDIQICFSAPYNSNATNKYITDGTLSYENDSWLPAYGAIWWFTSPVTIPAYSQIVVACFSAIDNTATYSASVDLSKSDYYWMSNSNVAQYTNAKYAVSNNIPASHYLTCSPFTQGNAWALSNSSPAFYIGKATNAEGLTYSTDPSYLDVTMGTSNAMKAVKYPQAKVVDAVEVWSAANVAKSNYRFPASINTGYVAVTNKLGYSVYRNVDKAATEALPENSGKLVYNYAGGTENSDGTTDPSGIDAEASIAAGAHIIYSDTNDSSKDFHQRKTASLKK